VTVNPGPAVSVNNDTICNGQSAILTATPSLTGGTFLWDNGETSQNITISPTLTTSYSVVYTLNGCYSNPVSGTVTVNPSPTVTVNSQTICIGQSATLTATPSMIGGTYLWNTGETTQTISTSPSSSNNYTVTYTLNDCGNSATSTVTVNLPLNVVTSGNGAFCIGNSAIITATPSGGDGTYTYSWSPGTGLSNPLISSPIASPAATTTYTVTVNDGCGTPSASASVLVMINPLPVADFSAPNNGCQPLAVQFTNLSDAGTYSWDFGDGNTSIDINPEYTYYDTGFYNAFLTVTDINTGCQSTSQIHTIMVFPLPTADFTMGPQPTTILNPNIHFDSKNSSNDVNQWLWDFSKIDSSALANPHYTFTDTGYFDVQLIVWNSYGCSDSIVYPVVINGSYTFYIPNAFTPDNDGINDYFGPKGTGIEEGDYEMRIYNRWGEQIHITNSLSKPWNGIPDNASVVAPNAVYVYLINVTDNLGQKRQYNGHFTLIR
ncbi:MAG: gliding motility-associated C-terminal domain-containing protein, partial [Bacteroidetes bacterium]|nr:gliding motility-associated C-terminal domain-containing protein [Bacteroidota bacterium]